MVSRTARQLAMRALSSAIVFSVSGCAGAALPDRYAAENFAVSHAAWTCRASGYMSGASRACTSVSASNFLAVACSIALSRQRSRLPSILAYCGITSYRFIADLRLLFRIGCRRRRLGLDRAVLALARRLRRLR